MTEYHAESLVAVIRIWLIYFRQIHLKLIWQVVRIHFPVFEVV